MFFHLLVKIEARANIVNNENWYGLALKIYRAACHWSNPAVNLKAIATACFVSSDNRLRVTLRHSGHFETNTTAKGSRQVETRWVR